MADISKIVLPDGTQYNFKDSYSRISVIGLSDEIDQVDDNATWARQIAQAAVPSSDYITTEEINQIWEAN